MEEEKLINLMKNANLNNLKLAYLIGVEGGHLTFMQFFMMLITVNPDKFSKKKNKIWSGSISRVLDEDEKLLRFKEWDAARVTLNFSVEFGYKGNYRVNYHFIDKCSNNYDSTRFSVKVLQSDISTEISKLFKKECLNGYKKGIKNFITFLVLFGEIEKLHIHKMHENFKFLLKV